MRTSPDLFKLSDGSLKAFSQMEIVPDNAILWCGYDYTNQYWVFEGKQDTRTLEQLRKAIING